MANKQINKIQLLLSLLSSLNFYFFLMVIVFYLKNVVCSKSNCWIFIPPLPKLNISCMKTVWLNIWHERGPQTGRDVIWWIWNCTECDWMTPQYLTAGPAVSFPLQHQRFLSVWPPDHPALWHKPYSSHMTNSPTHQSRSHKSCRGQTQING